MRKKRTAFTSNPVRDLSQLEHVAASRIRIPLPSSALWGDCVTIPGSLGFCMPCLVPTLEVCFRGRGRGRYYPSVFSGRSTSCHEVIQPEKSPALVWHWHWPGTCGAPSWRWPSQGRECATGPIALPRCFGSLLFMPLSCPVLSAAPARPHSHSVHNLWTVGAVVCPACLLNFAAC